MFHRTPMFHRTASHVGIAAILISLPAGPAVAQATPTPPPPNGAPARNADVWDGRSHVSGPAVRSAEQAAGVALPPAVQQQQTDEVEQLQQQILKRAEQGTDDGEMDGGDAAGPTP